MVQILYACATPLKAHDREDFVASHSPQIIRKGEDIIVAESGYKIRPKIMNGCVVARIEGDKVLLIFPAPTKLVKKGNAKFIEFHSKQKQFRSIKLGERTLLGGTSYLWKKEDLDFYTDFPARCITKQYIVIN